MAGHTVRAELLGIDEGDETYEDLHAAMAKRGFLAHHQRGTWQDLCAAAG
jgi:hypothetical protein